MLWSTVTLVAGEAITGPARVHLDHQPITDDLGHDRGGRDLGAAAVATDETA